jgi:hypothetical protein
MDYLRNIIGILEESNNNNNLDKKEQNGGDGGDIETVILDKPAKIRKTIKKRKYSKRNKNNNLKKTKKKIRYSKKHKRHSQ